MNKIDHFEFEGKSIEIEHLFEYHAIEVYINDNRINNKFPKTESFKINAGSRTMVLDYFYESKEFLNFYKLFKKALRKVMTKYKGFPSALLGTERIVLAFHDLKYHGASESHKPDFSQVTIKFGIVSIIESNSLIYNLLKHELYHTISSYHENESVQSNQLRRWERKLSGPVEKNKEEVKRWIDSVSRDIKSLRYINLNALFDNFYRYTLKFFWNHVADTALGIIALELEDEDYIDEFIARYENKALALDRFRKISSSMKKIIREAKTRKKRKYKKKLFELVQFMLAYNYIPFEMLPFALIDDYWHPKKPFFKIFKKQKYHRRAKKLIRTYEAKIVLFFLPESREAYMKFWNQYKEMTKHMNIWVDPLDPNITREIHNAECLESAKECYKTLNREFYKLFKAVKKAEDEMNAE
tara:strand:+ start:218 stop:1456 length:1239 start_codon:yes stop_codon:yes gene_type:complete